MGSGGLLRRVVPAGFKGFSGGCRCAQLLSMRYCSPTYSWKHDEVQGYIRKADIHKRREPPLDPDFIVGKSEILLPLASPPHKELPLTMHHQEGPEFRGSICTNGLI